MKAPRSPALVGSCLVAGAVIWAWSAQLAAHEQTAAAHQERRRTEQARLLESAEAIAVVQAEVGTCELAVELIDAANGQPLPGLVRIALADTTGAMHLPELVERPNGWHAMQGRGVVAVPQARLLIEALHGLETELATTQVDLAGEPQATVRLPLRRFQDLSAWSLYSGNTHLHLNQLSRGASDRYLQVVPAADDLDLLYVSYLERAIDDRGYITNSYGPDDLKKLSTPQVILRHGEEHRHNFEAYGEGFGHVMFLDIKRLVQPVSIGPGIMRHGSDGIPLRRGIETARADGASVIWCHNRFGFEDIPNWMAGVLHAQNIFDGGTHGSYEDSFYRYLNIGLAVPFSTGTDWFIYDFSRVYVPIEGPLTSEAWLAQLAAGRSFITNGPFLEFEVDGHGIGDTIGLSGSRELQVQGRALGRNDFRSIELVHNGHVIHSVESHVEEGHFVADLRQTLRVDEPGWVALRVALDAGKNDFNETLFGHTSPIYLEVNGKRVFHVDVAEELLAEMQRNLAIIDERGVFADEEEREAVLQVHREGIALLRARLE